MRTAVVYFPAGNPEPLRRMAKALAKGMESRGHRVDLIEEGRDSQTKLSIYEFVAIGTEAADFLGARIPNRIGPFLANAGNISGKRCFAFVRKKPLLPYRTLGRLMKAMEHEGMFLRSSEILKSAVEAEEIGRRLKIEPN